MIRKIVRRVKGVIRPPAVQCQLQHFFSQEGEDAILARIFEYQAAGFYVDVGAHHPVRFSNTYYFYLRGWRGINLDAMPASMDPFLAERPHDINLEMAVSETPSKLNFHIFNEPALNTFDPDLAKERDGFQHYRVVQVKEIQTQKLGQILEDHLPPGTKIDFMSVDVEGFDLGVLRSNNWEKFSPKYVLAEDSEGNNIEDTLHSEISKFLKPHGYTLFAKTVHTQIYRLS